MVDCLVNTSLLPLEVTPVVGSFSAEHAVGVGGHVGDARLEFEEEGVLDIVRNLLVGRLLIQMDIVEGSLHPLLHVMQLGRHQYDAEKEPMTDVI